MKRDFRGVKPCSQGHTSRRGADGGGHSAKPQLEVWMMTRFSSRAYTRGENRLP